MRTRNQNGMSLISVMVAAGIGLIVMLGMTSMLTDVFKSQRSVQSKDANRELISSIRQTLTDPVACANTFGALGPYTLPADTQTVLTIKDKNNAVIYDTVATYQNGLVMFSKFEITNYNSGTKQVDLNIYANKVGVNVGGAQMLTKIFLKVTLDAANKISQCLAVGSADSLWQLAANNADIYYAGGNVGVGTTAPQAMLDVAGGVKPGDQTQVTLCNAATEGSQRYNKITHQIEFCQWQSAGPPPVYNWASIGGSNIRNGLCSPTTGPDNAGTYSCPSQAGYSLLTFRGYIPGVQNTFSCCYVPPNKGQGWCSPIVQCASGGCASMLCSSPDPANYYAGKYVGVWPGTSEYHSCCFAPKDTSATSAWCGPMARADGFVSGCPAFPGYTAKQINSVTVSVARYFNCCYFPN